MTYQSKTFARYKRFWKRKTTRNRRRTEKIAVFHEEYDSLPSKRNEKQQYGDRWEYL